MRIDIPPNLNRSDARAYALTALALDKLEQLGDAVRLPALALLDRYQSGDLCSGVYIDEWRRLLDQPVPAIRAEVLALTDRARVLRTTAPFACFDPSERGAILEAVAEYPQRAGATPVRDADGAAMGMANEAMLDRLPSVRTSSTAAASTTRLIQPAGEVAVNQRGLTSRER